MNPLLNKLLEKIATHCNKSNELIEKHSFKITQGRYDFYHLLSISKRLALHTQLEALSSKTGSFVVRYAPRSFGEEIKLEFIDVVSCRKLLVALGVPVQSEVCSSAITALRNIQASMPKWLLDVHIEIEAGWLLGKKPYHCNEQNVAQVIDASVFLAWVDKADFSSVSSQDIRTISVFLYSDSKRLENIAGAIKNITKHRLPDELQTAKPERVLSYLGISRFPPLFRAKGALEVETKKGVIDTANTWPYFAISPDGIQSLDVTTQPSYILFIENQTTFERYTREVEDDGLILYTNGFPSKAWQKLFKDIAFKIEKDTKLFHWGDIDVGGYNICLLYTSPSPRD